MKTKISNATDETRIRELIEKWATSTRAGDDDEVLTNHATDILIFDVLSPLQYKGADAYRKSWDEWQPSLKNGTRFEIHDLDITTGDDVAFGHCLIECGNTLPNGEKNEDWVRATFCLRKIDSQWIVTHQHISMPIERKGGSS